MLQSVTKMVHSHRVHTQSKCTDRHAGDNITPLADVVRIIYLLFIYLFRSLKYSSEATY